MAGASDTYDLNGFGDWARRAGKDLGRGDFKKPLRACLGILVRHTKECFQGSHAPDGTPWARINPRPEGGDKPLLNHGILEASVSGKGPGAIAQVDASELIYGTNLDKARVHQFGAVIRPTKAKALAIPLTKEAVRAGSPRNFPVPLAMVKRPGKPPLLIETKEKGAATPGEKRPGSPPTRGRGLRAIMHYVLLKSVTIAARPFLGFSRESTEQITQVVSDWVGGKL